MSLRCFCHNSKRLFCAALAAALFVVILLLVTFAAPSFDAGVAWAEESQSDYDYNGIHIYIPRKMIAGQTYQGLVVTPEPAPFPAALRHQAGLQVHLATDTVGTISLPQTALLIPPGRNHALFEIDAVASGDARVHAIGGGSAAKMSGYVYSDSRGPHALGLFVPSVVTSAPEMLGVVMLLDRNGYPAYAEADVEVRVMTEGLLDVADEYLVIPKGRPMLRF